MKRKAAIVLLGLLLLGMTWLRPINNTLYEELWPQTFPAYHQIPFTEFVEQPDDITCGPTSVLMVLKWYGKDVTLPEVETHTKTEWFSYSDHRVGMTSPEYLPETMRHFGVPAAQKVGSLKRLKHEVSKDKPVVVLLRSGMYLWHYVVVIGYAEAYVTIADPAYGTKRILPMDYFLGAWSFEKDMHGYSMVGQCPLCGGDGRWIDFDIGPLNICELCSGSGKRTDYILALLWNVDARPYTMIIPDKSKGD